MLPKTEETYEKLQIKKFLIKKTHPLDKNQSANTGSKQEKTLHPLVNSFLQCIETTCLTKGVRPGTRIYRYVLIAENDAIFRGR